MMKKVVGTFERVSEASSAVRAIRTAGFLASDVSSSCAAPKWAWRTGIRRRPRPARQAAAWLEAWEVECWEVWQDSP